MWRRPSRAWCVLLYFFVSIKLRGARRLRRTNPIRRQNFAEFNRQRFRRMCQIHLVISTTNWTFALPFLLLLLSEYLLLFSTKPPLRLGAERVFPKPRQPNLIPYLAESSCSPDRFKCHSFRLFNQLLLLAAPLILRHGFRAAQMCPVRPQINPQASLENSGATCALPHCLCFSSSTYSSWVYHVRLAAVRCGLCRTQHPAVGQRVGVALHDF